MPLKMSWTRRMWRRGNYRKEFRDAEVLTMSEAHILLSHLLERLKEQDPTSQPPAMLQKTVTYVKRFTPTSSQATSNEIRKLLANYGLNSFELGSVGTLMPGSVEEARALVQTLDDPERFTDEELGLLLEDLEKLKQLG
eukprot:jgi/Botrbrau1/6468/Bobra.0034s0042.1